MLIFEGSPKILQRLKAFTLLWFNRIKCIRVHALGCLFKRVCSDRLYLFVITYSTRTHHWPFAHELKKNEEVICVHTSMSNAENNLLQEGQFRVSVTGWRTGESGFASV